ncbi:MAG: LytTR family DNA-binding domain-containing protein [Saprospiraceae bacterium]
MTTDPDYRLRTVVLEDEDDNREWLLKKLARYPELEIVGSAMTVDEAFLLIARTRPEAAFVDIQLIGGDAFQLLERLRQHGLPIPYLVMTTGYPEYVWTALNDYHPYVVQYLVKPFLENWQEKLRKSIDALLAATAKEQASAPGPANPGPVVEPPSIFVNTRGGLLRLDFEKICYLEAAGGGEVFVVTDTDTHQLDFTLNRFLDMLPARQFLRVSKSNVVNLSKIQRISREERTLEVEVGASKPKILGIGDAYYAGLMGVLPTIRPGS